MVKSVKPEECIVKVVCPPLEDNFQILLEAYLPQAQEE
jgi:hypothetical protein